MKKTTKILSAVALLLAALMLFSACSISYRTADTADYIQIAENAYRAVTLAIDKMVVDADDVKQFINDLRYQNKKVIKSSSDTNAPYVTGAVAAYDVLSLRYLMYDEEGNLVAHNFSIDSKQSGSSKLVLLQGTSLPIGFWPIGDPSSLNEGLDAWFEEQIFGDGSAPADYPSHVIGSNLLGDAATGITELPEILFCTFKSSYSTTGTTGDSATTVTPLHITKLLEQAKAGGTNSYNQAIALGLEQVITKLKAGEYAEGAKLKPGSKITINVYPNESDIPEGAAYEVDNAHIVYKMDFSNVKTGTSYDKGKIELTVSGVSTPDTGASALKPAGTYTYPSDATGKYKTEKGDSHDIKDTKCTAYIFFEERVGYEYPAYNAEFIKTTAGFASHKTDEAELKAEYEESVRKDLQEDCDLTAKKKAMSRLWDTAVKNTTLVKTPTANVKAYQKNELNYYKYLYYDYGYGNSGYYDDFEDFVVTMYSASGVSYDSFAAVENAIWADGVQQAKENLLTYYLADALGVRLTEAQLDEKLAAYAAKVAKEEVDYLKETYAFVDGESDTNRNNKKAWLEANGFTDASQIPDDFIKASDALEAIEDDKNALESILGGFQLDVVMEKLYDINLEGGTLTHPEADYDESKLVG